MDEGYVAAFELGIKLGTLYHQFIGMPIRVDALDEVERAIEASISSQPYVSKVEVRIDKEVVKKHINRFGYAELSGEMLFARISVEYGCVKAIGELSYDKENDYPLMKLVSIEKI